MKDQEESSCTHQSARKLLLLSLSYRSSKIHTGRRGRDSPQDSVCRVFIFKDTGVRPHLSVGLISVRQKGGLPGPPPVIPLPESLAAQGPYGRLSATVPHTAIVIHISKNTLIFETNSTAYESS